MTKRRWSGLAIAAALIALFACSESTNPVAVPSGGGLAAAGRPSTTGPTRLAAMIDRINASFEAAGSDWRLEQAWFFTTGPGADPYRHLRTGVRWPTDEVGYMLDASDYTTDVPASDVDAALVAAYDAWNDVANTSLHATRVADDGGNHDVLDGTYVGGTCTDIYDPTSPDLDLVHGLIYPYTDIVVGGWLPATYFEDCLGSADIIAVTWTFAAGDANHDNYVDGLYVEQYFNGSLPWVTTGAVYLSYAAGFDIQSIAVHEDGHTHGLGHFGGPNAREPFKLQPNGSVFDPEAVMNPYYLGGEKRDLYGTDEAALRSLYAR